MFRSTIIADNRFFFCEIEICFPIPFLSLPGNPTQDHGVMQILSDRLVIKIAAGLLSSAGFALLDPSLLTRPSSKTRKKIEGRLEKLLRRPWKTTTHLQDSIAFYTHEICKEFDNLRAEHVCVIMHRVTTQ